MERPKKKVGTLLDDTLLRQAKKRAAEEGRSLHSLIGEAISEYITHAPADREKRTAAFRTFCSQPIHLTGKQFQTVLESDPLDQ